MPNWHVIMINPADLRLSGRFGDRYDHRMTVEAVIFDWGGTLTPWHAIDGAVYSSEIDWTKPHPEAFLAAMAAVGVTDPKRCVFVGDRPWDDIHGAQSVGMRAVLIPHSDVPTFADATPDAVIESLAELVPLIESW